MRCCLPVLMVSMIWLLTGCSGDLINSTVERQMKSRLPEMIGPAESYRVEVHGSTSAMIRGRVKEVLIHGEKVWATSDLCLDNLDVKIYDLVMDRENMALTSVGAATFEAKVLESSLNDYLVKHRTGSLKAELLNGTMIVRAKPRLLSLSANVTMTGILVPDKQILNYQVKNLTVAGFKMPFIAARSLENWINPVLDMDVTGFEAELTSVSITPGVIIITGTTRPALDH